MSRPVSLLVAIVALVVEGLGAMAWGGLTIVLVRVFGGGVPPLAVVAIGGSVAFGLAALAVAVAAWRRRGWSWAGGVALQVVILLGIVVAIPYAGFPPPFVGAAALAVLGLVALLTPGTRRSLSG